MQGQPLLSPKLRRQESINNGRRIFLVGCFVFLLFAVLSLYYFAAFNANFRSYVSSSHDQIKSAIESYSMGESKKSSTIVLDDDDESAPLPRLKPKVRSDPALELRTEKDTADEAPATTKSTSSSSADDDALKSTLGLTVHTDVDLSAIPTQKEESSAQSAKAEEDIKKKEKEKEDEEAEKERKQMEKKKKKKAEAEKKKKEEEEEAKAKEEKESSKEKEDKEEKESSKVEDKEDKEEKEGKEDKEEKEEKKEKESSNDADSEKSEKSEKKKKKKSKKSEDSDDDDSEAGSTDGKAISAFPVCDSDLSEVIPCLDHKIHKKMKIKLNTGLMEHYERHCPTSKFRLRCLIPPPTGYKTPVRWPQSRDEVWVANVPHTFLAKEKSDQHWMVVEGDKIKFPGGGTHFHNGADKYIENLGHMLGNAEGDLSLGGKIRTVLDIGCGVASFGGYLLAQNILAMSVAPNDVHQNQIQFALERGIPAWLGVLGTSRLPYPSKSFELAHCSRCRIDWGQRDGVLLIELDRVLRPGGYWAWSAPPAYRDDEESKRLWKEVTDVTTRLCWTIAAHEGQTVIFQKPKDGKCYRERAEGTEPKMCGSSDPKPDEAWYTPLATCISAMPENYEVPAWPARVTAVPSRLSEANVEEKAFKTDSKVWKARVEAYWKMLGSAVEDDSIRNVMDMNANLGGFGAALNRKPVWVMNVVPQDNAGLRVVYDRGMLGTYHNWCEEFSTYPRTYDLLHASQVLTQVATNGCSIDDFLLESDRILRPKAWMIFRDTPDMISKVTDRLKALKWETVVAPTDADEDKLNDGSAEKILIIQKTLWFADE